MGAFEYTALDRNGRETRGVMEGDTPRAVRQQLRERGLTPLEVTEVAQREKHAASSFSFRRGIGATDLALMTRQLATLVRSGLPLEEALQAVAQQTEKSRIANMLLAVRARVMEGHTLAHGLADFPHIFPEIFRATVAAGEQSGHLDVVLERLADYAENRQRIQQRLMLSLLYPIILVGMSLLIVTGLLVYVVPKVTSVFDNVGQQLPLLTRALIAMSDFLREHGVAILSVLLILLLAMRQILKRPEVRRRFHALLLRIPLIGRLVRGFNTARFTRTLSILSSSGVPVLEAFRIARDVVTNIPMREAVEEAALRVREGGAISKSLAASGLFPPMTIHLIASGESSGTLDEMLERAAANQEHEMETLTAALLGIMEPLLILTMGVIVLLIVIAILLPIFEMNQLIH